MRLTFVAGRHKRNLLRWSSKGKHTAFLVRLEYKLLFVIVVTVVVIAVPSCTFHEQFEATVTVSHLFRMYRLGVHEINLCSLFLWM